MKYILSVISGFWGRDETMVVVYALGFIVIWLIALIIIGSIAAVMCAVIVNTFNQVFGYLT